MRRVSIHYPASWAYVIHLQIYCSYFLSFRGHEFSPGQQLHRELQNLLPKLVRDGEEILTFLEASYCFAAMFFRLVYAAMEASDSAALLYSSTASLHSCNRVQTSPGIKLPGAIELMSQCQIFESAERIPYGTKPEFF